MKTTSDIWYEVYDIGINQGLTNLNTKQLLLYNYIDLFYSLEMGALTSLLYNSYHDKVKFNNNIATLKYFGLNELAEIFIRFGDRFNETEDGREETWENFLNRTGIAKEIEELNDKILNLVTEDLVGNWIKENFNDLTK